MKEIKRGKGRPPKEPTEEILDEVCSTETRYPTLRADDETMTEIYRAMSAPYVNGEKK